MGGFFENLNELFNTVEMAVPDQVDKVFGLLVAVFQRRVKTKEQIVPRCVRIWCRKHNVKVLDFSDFLVNLVTRDDRYDHADPEHGVLH